MFKRITIVLISAFAMAVFTFSGVRNTTFAGDLKTFRGKDAGSDHRVLIAGKKKKTGPPAHAPAHGYRAKHQYRYFPSAHVYFDVNRKLYFYLRGGNWEAAISLPGELKVKLGSYVSIELETDKPYKYHKQHRTKYPPGQMKKRGKKDGKKK
jgi:hypothetical protein